MTGYALVEEIGPRMLAPASETNWPLARRSLSTASFFPPAVNAALQPRRFTMASGAGGCKRRLPRPNGRHERARALKPFPEERDKGRTTAPRRLPAILGQKIIRDGV